MAFDFVLPDLGEGITEGELRKWMVKEGDKVEEHQTVLEIETDKAIVEVPSPRSGTVSKIHKSEGDTVKVGEVLMSIAEGGEKIETPAEAVKAGERPRSISVVGVLPEAEEAAEEEKEELLATPAVRTMAKELGVRLESVKGSGPAGSITISDVKEAASRSIKTGDSFGETERIPLKGLRKTIARNLLASQRITASVTGMDEADITELWELREREKKPLLEKGVHLTFLPFFIKAVLHALSEHPYLNASVDDERDEIILKKYINIGVAVDTPDGLMVPVIKDPAKKTIRELAVELHELSVKARERKIKIEEMKGGTFTITNYGHFGGTFATPIINHPEVAILGSGKIADRPWVKDGQIVIRKIVPLSLTFDHRVTDGVDASRFLERVTAYIEDPALLFIESV